MRSKSQTQLSESKINKGLNIASGVGNVASSLLNEFSDDDSIEATRDMELSNIRSLSTKSALSSWVSDWVPQSTENMGLSGLSGAASGAAAGAVAGPWGALAGGIAGLAGGLFGAQSRNAQVEDANLKVTNAIKAQNNYLTEMQAKDALGNIAAFGGWVGAHGGDYPTGFNSFKSGGSHESNKLGGVPQGISENGVPNLVEEGETKWGDYIFSKRLKVPKGFGKLYNLKNIDDSSYADASKRISRESEERPFDSISRRGRDEMLARLQTAQEDQKYIDSIDTQLNQIFALNGLEDTIFAKGGSIHIDPSKKGTFTAAAKRHGQGVQEFARRVLANKENYSPSLVKKANFARNAAKWHADGGYLEGWMNPLSGTSFSAGSRNGIGPKVGYSPIGNVNFKVNTSLDLADPNIRNSYESIISPSKLTNISRSLEGKIGSPEVQKLKSKPVFRTLNEDITEDTASRSNLNNLGLFAPALTNLGTTISAIASTPEQVNLDRLDLSPYKRRRYLPYDPIDQEYLANKYRAQTGAITRKIIDSSAGNPSAARAALVAHNFNNINSLGDLYIKADETNRQRKERSIRFDSEQDRQLAALSAQEQQFNALQGLREYEINAKNRAARRNAINQGLNTLGSNLAEISRYNLDKTAVSNMFPMYNPWTGEWVGNEKSEGGFLFNPEIDIFLKTMKKGGK